MLARRITMNGRPLHLAAEIGHEAVVHLLMKHMVDVHVKDNDGRTALHRVAENGYEAEVWLLDYMVDVDMKDDGRTALHLAAEN
jgi:ankyrin repeat protein